MPETSIGYELTQAKQNLQEAIGCLKLISKLSIGNKTIPYAERIAIQFLKERGLI